MNLLTSLLLAIPPAPIKREAPMRSIFAPEMRKLKKAVPLRDSSYGTVQPMILSYLKTVDSLTPDQIGTALNLHKDAVRRGIRALEKKQFIVCVRKTDRGRHIPSLWKAK